MKEMKVYIVFLESGNIYGVYKNKEDANMIKKHLIENKYDNATVKQYNVK